jgi:hypothetical protein
MTNTNNPSPQAVEAVAVTQAITLIDEINERSTSRQFYGIDQTLHAKLCTIRATLARHRLTAMPTQDRVARGEAKLKGWVEYDPPVITRESSRLRHAYFSGWEAADANPAALPTPPADTDLIEPLLRFHETGGHEGDGSDERISAIRQAHASPPSPASNEPNECPACKGRAFAAVHGGGFRCVNCKRVYGLPDTDLIERHPWFCEFPRSAIDEIVRQVREIQAIPVPSDEHIEVIAEAVWNGLCDSGVVPPPAQSLLPASNDHAGLMERLLNVANQCGPRSREIVLEAADALQAHASPREFPKLTDAMIEAACEAHYGKRNARKAGGADGIDMTADGNNWSFRQALKRMWPAIARTALEQGL